MPLELDPEDYEALGYGIREAERVQFEQRAAFLKAREAEYRASSEYRSLKKASNRKASAKRYADPEKRKKVLLAVKEYQQRPEVKARIKAKKRPSRAAYQRAWRAKNRAAR